MYLHENTSKNWLKSWVKRASLGAGIVAQWGKLCLQCQHPRTLVQDPSAYATGKAADDPVTGTPATHVTDTMGAAVSWLQTGAIGERAVGEPENKAHSLSFSFFLTLHHCNFQINIFKKITKKNLKSMHIGDVRNTHEVCLKLRFPIFIFSIKFSKNPYIYVCI